MSSPHRLDLDPVHVHVDRGSAGAEQADEAGLLVALDGQVVRLGLQRVEVDVAGPLHHQLEAAGVAEARHRRRPEHVHDLRPVAEVDLVQVAADAGSVATDLIAAVRPVKAL